MNRSFRSLEIYEQSKKLVVACYALTHDLPPEEETNFSRYIRTAALNVHLNVAQGVFLKKKKRKKFLGRAKDSLVIVEAAVEILVEVGFATREQTEPIVKLCSSCYQLIDQL